jgi:hypothetical protein
MTLASKMGKLIANGVVAAAISAAVFVALAIGIISRPASEEFSVGG